MTYYNTKFSVACLNGIERSILNPLIESYKEQHESSYPELAYLYLIIC